MAVVNYKNVIDNIQSILKDWNKATATYDLSTNLDKRIGVISKRNPSFIVDQPSQLPAICIRIDNDTKAFEEMSRTNLQASKKSELTFSIIGLLWYNPLLGNVDANDPSDDEIHYMAENVEEVLRRNHKLNGSVLYSYPESIDFYEDLDEESYFRTFVMSYKAILFY